MFEAMLKDSTQYRESLDTPYLVGDPVPETVNIQIGRDDKAQSSLSESGDSSGASPTQTGNSAPSPANRSEKKPGYDKTYENVEFVTPDSPLAKPAAEKVKVDESDSTSKAEVPKAEMPASGVPVTDVPEIRLPDASTTRPPTLVVPE
jgi:hypothetical protein